MPHQSQCKQILDAIQAAQQQYNMLQYAEILEQCLIALASDSGSTSTDNSTSESSDLEIATHPPTPLLLGSITSSISSTSSISPIPPDSTSKSGSRSSQLTSSDLDSSPSTSLFFLSQDFLKFQNILQATYDEISCTCILAPHIHTIHAPQIHLLKEWKLHRPHLFH